jgi:nucleotide-binding universal stress UspA family protein
MRARPARRHARATTIPEEGEMNESPILICYDGSDGAQRAIDTAAVLLGPRHAVVLDVGSPLSPAESLAAVTDVPLGPFEDANLNDAVVAATEGANRAKGAGFDAVARGSVAAPTWEGVVVVADEIDAAVIVTGSRGLNGAEELFDGSLSHDIARHAGRPVLIVPPPHHTS